MTELKSKEEFCKARCTQIACLDRSRTRPLIPPHHPTVTTIKHDQSSYRACTLTLIFKQRNGGWNEETSNGRSAGFVPSREEEGDEARREA